MRSASGDESVGSGSRREPTASFDPSARATATQCLQNKPSSACGQLQDHPGVPPIDPQLNGVWEGATIRRLNPQISLHAKLDAATRVIGNPARIDARPSRVLDHLKAEGIAHVHHHVILRRCTGMRAGDRGLLTPCNGQPAFLSLAPATLKERHRKLPRGTSMDAKIQAWFDQQDASDVATIRRYGWLIQYVSSDGCSVPQCDCTQSDDPPFAYTIGLFGLSHPELLIVGVSQGTAAAVLNNLGERIRAGETILPGQLIEFDEWPRRIIPEPVPNPGEIVLGANRYYQRPPEASVPVLQLSYDDTSGRFPWEQDYAAPETQPRPGSFTA